MEYCVLQGSHMIHEDSSMASILKAHGLTEARLGTPAPGRLLKGALLFWETDAQSGLEVICDPALMVG